MQSYIYNDYVVPRSYNDDERYDEEELDEDFVPSRKLNGTIFCYPSYDENEDMM